MKTAFIKARPSQLIPAATLICIFLLTFFSGTDLFSQTPKKYDKSNSVLVPMMHYEHKAKAVSAPTQIKVYSVLEAKSFPKLEGIMAPALQAMDDSEEVDYTILCTRRVNHQKEAGAYELLAVK